MAEISAGMVRELREKTDAPMMECKKALTEAAGDMSKAEEILRVKLGNKATKASGRVTAEGVVAVEIAQDAKSGAIVEINCETDFVAKNDEFLAFARDVAKLVASENPADVAQLSAKSTGAGTIEARRTALIGKIGENISVRRFSRLQAKGRLATYIHGGSKIGVIVDLVGGDEVLAKDLAMHIAASKPLALSREDVSDAVVQKEREIAAAKAAESGKPANIVDKMVEGSIAKFLKEVTLLGQPFVKNDKQTIAELLKSKDASVAAYTLYVVGEGIEKRKDDFVAEVRAQAAKAAESSAQPS
jgi:elongation factor Ts